VIYRHACAERRPDPKTESSVAFGPSVFAGAVQRSCRIIAVAKEKVNRNQSHRKRGHYCNDDLNYGHNCTIGVIGTRLKAPLKQADPGRVGATIFDVPHPSLPMLSVGHPNRASSAKAISSGVDGWRKT